MGEQPDSRRKRARDREAEWIEAPDEPALTFADRPRTELDRLLAQLLGRARDMIATQERLRELLRASQTINADLAPTAVLEHIATAAREVVGARYAALGVLDGQGGLAEFVHVGMPDVLVDALGHLPQGKGLLGALIADPRPLRIEDLSADPRSSGFPPGHPPMGGFLGVPIRIRDEVFGNLYLTESTRGGFSAEDEELALSLAATAAVVIDNARRYAAARRRGEWSAATAAVTRRMLTPDVGRPLGAIAEHARRLADADLVAVLLPDEERRSLQVDTAVGGPTLGVAAVELVGYRSPVDGSLCGHVFSTGRSLRLADARDHPGLPPPEPADAVEIGPVLVVPLTGNAQNAGVLAVTRLAGRAPFDPEDLTMAAGFAAQAAVALELDDARTERERAAMLDERDRIAADLHDHVIQRLFASGLALQGLAARVHPTHAESLRSAVVDLDDTIAQIRTSVFAIRHTRAGPADEVRSTVLAVVTEAATVLGQAPQLRFSGPVDTVLAGLDPTDRRELVDDLCAVVREALTNVAKHAHATRVEVDLRVTGPDDPGPDDPGPDDPGPDALLSLVVSDDGLGIPYSGRRSGLANLRRRAERHGGHLTITRVAPHGTRVEWSVPLTPGDPGARPAS
ncbi:GAF domain-containing protein [Pseudonocardia sp. RS010]|uniref:sensor histidine kinase n=1 Tax=Pseudonocardia sp. RS010 TaxID=3385979 RepID=UPI0039A32866